MYVAEMEKQHAELKISHDHLYAFFTPEGFDRYSKNQSTFFFFFLQSMSVPFFSREFKTPL